MTSVQTHASKRSVLRRLVGSLAVAVATVVGVRVLFRLSRVERTAATALPAAAEGRLAASIVPIAASHPGLTGIEPLRDGPAAFAARMVLADAATWSIDAQYYIWHPDLTGLMLLNALHRAAERGVRVRLLLDDNGIDGLDPHIAQLDAHPCAEVRLYNPFNLRRGKRLAYAFDFPRLNRRMHNKSFTVDGLATVVGGRNVGDEYFGTGSSALYIDRDVLAVGAVVPDVGADFDTYWNCPCVHPAGPIVGPDMGDDPIGDGLAQRRLDPQWDDYRRILRASELIERLTGGRLDLEWTRAVLLSDDPAKGEGRAGPKQLLANRLHEAVGGVNASLDGVSPYFVPGRRGVEAFGDLVRRGVRVRLLTNALEATDVLPVHAGYSKHRRALLERGVELYELKREVGADSSRRALGPFGSSGASLHAKTFAVDGKRVYVGSFNFDPRSRDLNTEMGLLIDSDTMAREMREAFDRKLDDLAYRVELREDALVWIDGSGDGERVLRREPGSSPSKALALATIQHLPVEWLL